MTKPGKSLILLWFVLLEKSIFISSHTAVKRGKQKLTGVRSLIISLRLLTLRTKLERKNKMPNVRLYEPRK